jgi:hypothetical protein
MSYRKFLTFMPQSGNQVHVLLSSFVSDGSSDDNVQAALSGILITELYTMLTGSILLITGDFSAHWIVHHNICSKCPPSSWAYALQRRRIEPRKVIIHLGRFLMSAVAILNFYVIKFLLQASPQVTN